MLEKKWRRVWRKKMGKREKGLGEVDEKRKGELCKKG